MDWSTWIQQVGGGLAAQYGQSKYVQPYEIQKLQLEQQAQNGGAFQGQPTLNATGLHMTTGTMLLIGGGLLVAVLMLKG